jgi:DNA-binding XRE family transcriptional regulator
MLKFPSTFLRRKQVMKRHVRLTPTNHLKQVRQACGLALYGLAARAKVSPTTLSAIERWDYQPGSEVRERIAAALGVSVADIWPEGEVQG